MRTLLILSFLIVFVLGLSYITNANASIQVDINPYLGYLDPANHIPYKLVNNATHVTVNSLDGSAVFDKNACSVAYYNTTNTFSKPIIPFDKYLVLAEQNGTTTWNLVSIINNAACVTTVTNSTTSFSIVQTKSVAGAGSFSLNYTKQLNHAFKLTFSATNNNPAWIDKRIGIREIVGMPKMVTLGNQTFDLSQHNNTGLNRSWISTHNSQLIQFSNNAYYDMGLGWNYASSITDIYQGGQASLQIDYTFNTPILQPGNTITIDPAIAYDTIGTIVSVGVTTNATQAIPITIANNPNRLVVVGISYRNSPNNAWITSVKIGTLTFTELKNKTSAGPADMATIFYLKNPPTGAVHITITPNNPGAGYYMVANAYSLYNVNQTTSMSSTSVNATSGSGTPAVVQVTPTHVGSWLVDSVNHITNVAPSANTPGTSGWSQASAGQAGASQRYTSPTINGKNNLQWTVTTNWLDVGAEIIAIPSLPSTPTLTHANTLNNTAIKLDWPTISGATFYLIKQASPYTGAYSQIANITTNTLTVNSLAGGTQYGFKVVAGNSSGLSSDSALKSNYTKNIAPTSPAISAITSTGATVTVTNPSGNFSGYNIYLEKGSGSNFTLFATTSTTANSYPFTGLLSSQLYTTKLATRYAVGSNYSGISANSTTVAFTTLPSPPTSLGITQTVVNQLNLAWGASPSSGLTGYKIERSIDYGVTWIVLVANTASTGLTYNDVGLITGDAYTYRVSAITTAGTSAPTSPVTATVLSAIQLSPTGSVNNYDITVPSITWNTEARNSTNWDMFVDASNNGTAVSWFHAKSGSSTVSKILGYGTSSFTMTGTPNTNVNNKGPLGYGFQSNNGWIYLVNTGYSVDHYYIGNGTKKHDFTASTACATSDDYFLVNQNSQPIIDISTDGACNSSVTTLTQGNSTYGIVTIAGSPQYAVATSATTNYVLWEFNNTIGQAISPTSCSLYQINSNFTQTLLPDKIACDWSMQQSIKKYYYGMQFTKQGNVYSTNALDLFQNTNTLAYNTKLLMTVDNNVLGIPNNTPNARFILHAPNGDYMIVVTSTKIYYQLTSTILSAIETVNRTYQSYYIEPYTATTFPLSTLTSTNPMKIYAVGINNTENLMGLTQIISGFSYKGTSIESAIRTVDPRWSNDNTDIPLLTTTGSLFQIFLTVADAPTNAAIMVTNPALTLNSIAGVWTVVILDATHTAEFDIPQNQCGLVYVADVTHVPTIWSYEGQICATGINQKTMTYTNTLPLTFYTTTYGVTDSFTPSTNGLTTTFRTTIPNTSYTVTISNSTGGVAQQFTFTMPQNATVQTESYNVSSVAKPATLAVTVAGNQIYTAYLGSPMSLATVASFFHQYLNYQGFDFLSFIPIIFAAMFTRNTVGIGAALTVVLIATLSFFSVVVVPDTLIYISIFIAIIGMIGYRSLYG